MNHSLRNGSHVLYLQRRPARGTVLREMRIRAGGKSCRFPGILIPLLEGRSGRLPDTE